MPDATTDANTPAPPAHANEPSAIEKALNILPQFQSNGILPFEQIASDARAELAAMHAELRSARQDSKRLRDLEIFALNTVASWRGGGWRAETRNESDAQAAAERLSLWPITESQIIERRDVLDAAITEEAT